MKIETAMKLDLNRDLLRDMDSRSMRARHSVLKRLMDIAIAAPMLVLLAPLLLAVAIIVRIQDKGPALFAQNRIGLDGRAFRCYKFRTMCTDAAARLETLLATDADARAEWARDQKLRNDPRITRIGKLLRKSSLDELPQLWNILVGEMSIIGPRPIVASEIERYGADFGAYCSVRPGVTGLWQVSGRNDTTYEQRVAMDVYYATHWTIWLDLEILFKTLPAILFSRGAY